MQHRNAGIPLWESSWSTHGREWKPEAAQWTHQVCWLARDDVVFVGSLASGFESIVIAGLTHSTMEKAPTTVR